MATIDLDAVEKQFRDFSRKELEEFKDQFLEFDQDKSGSITTSELRAVMESLGEKATEQEIQELISEYDHNQSGTVEFVEFLSMISDCRRGKKDFSKGFGRIYAKQVHLQQVKGKGGAVHSFAEEERTAFVEHINSCLQDDDEVKEKLPLDPDNNDLFDKVKDGVLLCKLINCAQADTIDERAINLPKAGQKLPVFKVTENNNLVINSAKAIGCVTVNVGADDLAEGKVHIVLGLIWQIVKVQLVSKISVKNFPELVVLLDEGEELADLLKLPPEQLLLRWFNYHLKNSGCGRKVSNFSGDIKDSVAYTHLLNQIAPESCDLGALEANDLQTRAEKMLVNAGKINCRKFVQPKDVVKGNAKLNLAFVATIFNTRHGLRLPSEVKVDMAELDDEDESDSREERAFRNWLNNLPTERFVNNLFEDLRDGVVLLQALEKLKPGIVDWKQVELSEKKLSKVFSKVGNCNYAVVLGKQLKLSLVNIGGKDVVDGNRKLTLGMMWQMMRYNLLDIISRMAVGGSQIDEKGIIKWANDAVKAVGRASAMRDFKDKSLASGVFLLDLLSAVEPRAVNADLVTPGATDEEKKQNARYIIAVARKIGCSIFLLWEDIVDVKPKMILTLVGSIMMESKKPRAAAAGASEDAAEAEAE